MGIKIKHGVATWATIIVGVVGATPVLVSGIVDQIENVQTHWSSADKTQLLTSAALIVVGAAGKYAQAVVAIIKGAKEV